jgi:hypothetical protein
LLTFDGTATNFSTANVLGADLRINSLKTHFLHPCTREEVFVILDAYHMIKLVRNALGEWLYFVNGDGKNICWQFFDDLVSLQEEKGLHLANKIRRRHINFQGEKMKVKLALQTFSSRVADALEYCCKDLKLQNFEDADKTISFCRIFDKIFDLLNSRNSLTKNAYKKTISGYNINFIKQFFNQAKEYTYFTFERTRWCQVD